MIRPVKAHSIVFWATIIIWIRAAYGQNCDRFNTSRIPVVEPGSSRDMDYFSCDDGAFFTSVDVWHSAFLGELRWICTDGDTSYFPDELGSYLNYSRVTFDVGLTAVETSFRSDIYDSSDSLVYLGDCYIGGYNFSTSASTSDGGIFVRSGPFGTGRNYTNQTWSSSCPDGSYAAGAIWWTSPSYNFVNGIQLECAEVTSTCYPPGLENQGTDDDLSSTEADDATDVIDTMVSNDTSSGTEMVTIIAAAAIGAAVAVVAIAVITCLCFFFEFKSHRESIQAEDTQGHQGNAPRNAGVPPVDVTTSQIVAPTAPAYPPAYTEPPPGCQPQAAPTAPNPEHFPPGHSHVEVPPGHGHVEAG